MKDIIEEIYPPEEDSFLLEKYVKEYAFGDVLDMGTGSGIQGIAASKNSLVRSVSFADINIAAIKKLKEKYSTIEIKNTIGKHTENHTEKYFFYNTDLFRNIPSEKRYDTIIFNPPYLPDDEYDNAKHITTGGKRGHEILEKFLIQVKSRINDGGIILIVFSSLTNKRIVNNIIRRESYDWKILETKNLFMERLYAYILTPIVKYKGHRGMVNTCIYKKKGKFFVCAVKSQLDSSGKYNISKEAKFLTILNTKGIGPKILKNDVKNGRLVMEFAYGMRIMQYFEYSDKKEILFQIIEILKQLKIMDDMNINKLEMTNPYKHILLSKERTPIMIDFERAYYSSPKNITQFIQFLTSGKMGHILRSKNISLDILRMRIIAKEYKTMCCKNLLSSKKNQNNLHLKEKQTIANNMQKKLSEKRSDCKKNDIILEVMSCFS